MNKKLMMLLMPVILGACTYSSTTASNNTTTISEAALQHHNWTLIQVDNHKLTDLQIKEKPNLEIGENMRATGFAGCNHFFGQSILRENQFKIEKMAISQKMCFGQVMGIENILSDTLTQYSTIILYEDYLKLHNGTHQLIFKLNDYK
ncbi:META domain-containing protein [Vibrio albus]|nr:META domain-containing protein [Vibrio albus]